jgi:opacity protein-like surface antigen
MMISLRSTVLALSVAVAVPAMSSAQGTTTFNLAGGLSLANGDFGNRNDAGYTLGVGVGIGQRNSPASLRLEGMFSEFESKLGGDKARAGGLLGSAVYDLNLNNGGAFTPYAIGGIGFYSTREPALFGNDESDTNFGWNAGGGVRVPLTGFSVYFEARYHSVSNAGVQFAPIVVGLRF